MDRFGPGAMSAFLSAAGQKRRQVDAAPDIKRPDAFRAVKFMGRDGKKIDRCFAQTDWDLAGGVHPVDVHESLRTLLNNFGDLADREQDACFVVCEHY